MKTWQQFNEDADSYAKDKKAYEKQTASKRKLDARRRALKTRMASLAKKFAQKSKAKKRTTDYNLDQFRNDYEMRREITRAKTRN